MSVDYGGSGSDDSVKGKTVLETEKSDVTKLSRSTILSKRSRGVRNSRRQKHMAHAVEKAASNGEVFVPLSQEEYREEQRKKMICFALDQPVDRRRPPQEVIEENLRLLAEQKMTMEEKVEWARQLDEYFRPKFVKDPQWETSWEEAHRDSLDHVEGDQWSCRLCDKQVWGGKWAAQDSHCKSAPHTERLKEQAAANEMIGRCKSARRFEKRPGYQGVLNGEDGWDGFKDFWGTEVLKMPDLVWNRLRQGVRLRVDMPHWGKSSHIMVDAQNVCDIVPGAVSYGGQGKYIDGVDKVLVYGKCDQLIDNDGYQKQPEDREGSGRRAGHGRGWWPVSVITWHGQHSDHGYPDAAAYFRDAWSGRTRCYVLCWYHLFDGTMALQVWATYIM